MIYPWNFFLLPLEENDYYIIYLEVLNQFEIIRNNKFVNIKDISDLITIDNSFDIFLIIIINKIIFNLSKK